MKKSNTTIAKSSRNSIKNLVCIAIIIVLALLAGFFFYKYQTVNDKYQEAIKTQEDRNKETVAMVEKLYNIPAYDKETPTIFYVKDKDQIGGSEHTKKFFELAQNDDVVIAYKDADVSLIYRESDNKVIKTDNYANFTAAVNPISVAIIASAASQQSLQDELTKTYNTIYVVTKNEPKTTTISGIVVDVKGDQAEAANKLAALLGYAVGNLPAGETAPEGANFIIIAPSQ